MQPKQLAIVIAAVALLSAGLGVVITSSMRPKEVKVSLDIGGGQTLDLSKLVGDAGDLGRARISANENAAIATLRSIASAQEQAVAAAVIDTDGDTGGEYAYLGELAGTASLRGSTEFMEPALLVSSLGNVTKAGIAERTGYHFRVFLPGSTVGDRTPGLPEGSRAQVDGGNAEILWCAYAWPAEVGVTGTRAFFMNQEGDLIATPNADHGYSGEDRAPAFDAALSTEDPGDMVAPLATFGGPANDGRPWSVVGF